VYGLFYSQEWKCGVYGREGIIVFNNTPCQFPLRSITKITYYTGTASLVVWLLAILLQACMLLTDCCAVVRSEPSYRKCSGVPARKTADHSSAIYPAVEFFSSESVVVPLPCRWMARGCSDGRRYERLLISDERLFTPLRRMFVLGTPRILCETIA
jgi:hypothetical protein